MSYTGMGATPYGRARGASFGRATRRDSIAPDSRGLFGLLGFGLGAAAPSTTQGTTGGAAALAAAAAVRSASATQLAGHIAAVEAFQQAYGHGLTVDGRYGANTRAALVTATGQSDLPAVGGGGGGSHITGSYVSTTPAADPGTDPGAAPEHTTPTWLVPVAVVSVLVLVAGGIMYRQRKPVAANRRHRRSR